MSDGAGSGGLAPLPEGFTITREGMNRVAAHILARRRFDAVRKIGLRASPGGIATPAFGAGVEVLRTDGDALVVERDGVTSVHRMTRLDDLARAAGVDLAAPASLGGDAPAMGDPSGRLGIDDGAARVLGDWFWFVTTVLDACLRRLGAVAAPAAVQLWPEHFDVACDVSWGPEEGQRVNLGGSPGDGYDPEPYLYVGPWGPERPHPEFWNAPFGATLGYDALRAEGGLDATRAAAVRFLERGLDHLASA